MSKYYNLEYLYALIYDCINLFEKNRYFFRYQEIDEEKDNLCLEMMKKLNINIDSEEFQTEYYNNKENYNIKKYKDEYIKKFGEKEYLQIENKYNNLNEEYIKIIKHDNEYNNNFKRLKKYYINNITNYFNNEIKFTNINSLNINNVIDKNLIKNNIINFNNLFKNFNNKDYFSFLKDCDCWINDWNLDSYSYDIKNIHQFELHEYEWYFFTDRFKEIDSFKCDLDKNIDNCYLYHLLIKFLENKNISFHSNFY